MKILLAILFFSQLKIQAQLLNQKDQALPDIQQQVWRLTEVMFHDVVNPPAAARFYAYSLLGGYETYCRLDDRTERFQAQLKNYPVIKKEKDHRDSNKEFAALYAILETGKAILPSGYLLEEKQSQLINEFIKAGLARSVIDSSVVIAKMVSGAIVAYAKSDGYFQLSVKPRYKPMNSDESWQPTPPEYMGAVEPHWRSIRTFFLDSVQQCKPAPPVQFDKNVSSPFMKLAQEVYTTGQQLTEEQKLIANFWDCNPFAVQFEGHMSIGLKKISPGGHWMSIAGIASKKAKLNFSQTLFLHTIVALTLHDAFISCWDEKYRSNRVRPETYINKYIDAKWKPLLQTPPFPEYSSGHSVISTASAEVLTYFLGDGFSFLDSTETYIGLPARSFSSFRTAAAEARISRLYGGIHFRDAIDEGGEQGRKVGEFVIQKLKIQPLQFK